VAGAVAIVAHHAITHHDNPLHVDFPIRFSKKKPRGGPGQAPTGPPRPARYRHKPDKKRASPGGSLLRRRSALRIWSPMIEPNDRIQIQIEVKRAIEKADADALSDLGTRLADAGDLDAAVALSLVSTG
jgi:hypothetical protein